MRKALELLKKHAACFQSVCQILEEHLFNPIQNGQRLSMRPLKLGASGSWQSKLMEAMNGHQRAQEKDSVRRQHNRTNQPTGTVPRYKVLRRPNGTVPSRRYRGTVPWYRGRLWI